MTAAFLIGLAIGSSAVALGFILHRARRFTSTESLETTVAQLKAQRDEQGRVIVDLQDRIDALREARR